MTLDRDTIMRLAAEAGLINLGTSYAPPDLLIKFAELVLGAQREPAPEPRQEYCCHGELAFECDLCGLADKLESPSYDR